METFYTLTSAEIPNQVGEGGASASASPNAQLLAPPMVLGRVILINPHLRFLLIWHTSPLGLNEVSGALSALRSAQRADARLRARGRNAYFLTARYDFGAARYTERDNIFDGSGNISPRELRWSPSIKTHGGRGRLGSPEEAGCDSVRVRSASGDSPH